MQKRAFCYVVMPSKKNSIKQRKKLIEKIIKPTIIAKEGNENWTDIEDFSINEIHNYIQNSEICIADMTIEDVSVYYQLGYADGIGKPFVLMRSKKSKRWKQPVDIQGRRCTQFSFDDEENIMRTKGDLWETINTIEEKGYADYSQKQYQKLDIKKNACFFITPIGEEGSSRREKADNVLVMIVNEALRGCADEGAVRGDHSVQLREIGADVRKQIMDAEICVCDLSENNPNVYYEWGYATALSKPTILIKEIKENETTQTSTVIPSDCINYSLDDIRQREDAVIKLRKAIRETLNSIRISPSKEAPCPTTPPPKPRKRWPITLSCVIVAILLVVGGLFYMRSEEFAPTPTPTPTPFVTPFPAPTFIPRESYAEDFNIKMDELSNVLSSISELENIDPDEVLKQLCESENYLEAEEYLNVGNPEEALRRLTVLSDEGNLNATVRIGYMYLYGEGVSSDPIIARTYFNKAAEGKHTTAMCIMGIMSLEGIGGQKDEERAYIWFKTAADQNNSYAMRFLGEIYRLGRGVPQDYKSAFDWYKKAADIGDVRSMNCLGVMYDNGYGVAQNYEKAIDWYERAAQEGVATAMYNLGNSYYDGKGVEQSYDKAFELYECAAQNGNAAAMNSLGVMYQCGYSVEQSYEMAFEWYSRAAQDGDATALYNLGTMYNNGYNVEQSHEKAFELFEQAAQEGEDIAMYWLGVQYKNGEGVEQNYEKAFEWFERAAQEGNASAMNSLGVMYYDGKGVEQSYEKAAEWYGRAANEGYASAMYNLGVMYYDGKGVEQSYDKAFE
ncbi:MAG: SEL1-like repeat protein, partial [Clostridia bacterium]|nr:SEL1-like repeat protein [Clostridia bacterium]